MEYAADQSSPPSKRKKIRKGTHSCQECRRRKVKCIFASPADATCIVCTRRRTRCISQWDGPDSSNAVITPISQDVEMHATDLYHSLPTPESTVTAQTWDKHVMPAHLVALRTSLLAALPSRKDVEILSSRLSIISTVCYQSDYRSHSGSKQANDVHVQPLTEPEEHPTLLARQMLLLAATLQHISSPIAGLTEHPEDIAKRLSEAAIKVNLDDSLLGSLEGLECLIFEIFYHIDGGNVRRAWITARRAVTVAQMVALHRPGKRFKRLQDTTLEPEIMWSTIISIERLLSLLLGLPTSTTSLRINSTGNLSSLVGNLAGKILVRNQLDSAQAQSMTAEIDRDVIIAGQQMPPEFWQPLAFVKLERDSPEAVMEVRRAFGHMCYYTLIIQLHLPHMLAPDSTQRIYAKVACANASRELLNREIELRSFDPLSAHCRIYDLLAFIAGMALLLSHITGDESLLAHQRLGDRAIVQRALHSLDLPAEEGDVLAIRCTAVLKDLLMIEQASAQGAAHDDGKALIMQVPYLGSVRIARDGVSLASAHENNDEIMPGTVDTPVRSAMPTPSSSIYDNRARPRSAALYPDAGASFEDWVLQGVDTAFMESLMHESLDLDLEDGIWDPGAFHLS